MGVNNDRFLKLFAACRIANQNYVFNETTLFNFINQCKENKKHGEIINNIECNDLKTNIEIFKNNKIFYDSEDNLTEISMNINIIKLINSDFTNWDNIAEFSNDYSFYEQKQLKNNEIKIYTKKDIKIK